MYKTFLYLKGGKIGGGGVYLFHYSCVNSFVADN